MFALAGAGGKGPSTSFIPVWTLPPQAQGAWYHTSPSLIYLLLNFNHWLHSLTDFGAAFIVCGLFVQVEGGESRCGAAPRWAVRNLWDLFPQSCPGPWALADTASGQGGCLSLWENVWGSRLALEPSVPCSLPALSSTGAGWTAQEPLCTLSHLRAHLVMLTLSFQHSHASGTKKKGCLNFFYFFFPSHDDPSCILLCVFVGLILPGFQHKNQQHLQVFH